VNVNALPQGYKSCDTRTFVALVALEIPSAFAQTERHRWDCRRL